MYSSNWLGSVSNFLPAISLHFTALDSHQKVSGKESGAKPCHGDAWALHEGLRMVPPTGHNPKRDTFQLKILKNSLLVVLFNLYEDYEDYELRTFILYSMSSS